LKEGRKERKQIMDRMLKEEVVKEGYKERIIEEG
jgi:hypothetical protein